jgi:hypothetical protein
MKRLKPMQTPTGKTILCLSLALVVCFLGAGCSTTAERARWPSEGALQLAEGGDLEAQCKVGWAYLMGKNYPEAAKWLQKAADAGNVNSTGAAGMLFIEGRGVKRDVAREIHYLRQGAESPDVGGNGECASDLAEIYASGKLVPRNDAEAYYLLGVAVANHPGEDADGMKERQKLIMQRKAVGARLTAEQRGTEDDRVRKWIAVWRATGCEWLDGL